MSSRVGWQALLLILCCLLLHASLLTRNTLVAAAAHTIDTAASPPSALEKAQRELAAAQAAADALERDDAHVNALVDELVKQQQKTTTTTATTPAAAAASTTAGSVPAIPKGKKQSSSTAAPTTQAHPQHSASPTASSSSSPTAAPAPSSSPSPSLAAVASTATETASAHGDLTSATSTLESSLSPEQLNTMMSTPGSHILPGSRTNKQASRIISDTYERELEQNRRAQIVNAAEERAVQEEVGEDVDPDCPYDGTFHQLRRFGHRLWYEGDVKLSRVCLNKAVSLYLSPTNVVEKQQERVRRNQQKNVVAPSEDEERYKNVFIETKGMQEKVSADVSVRNSGAVDNTRMIDVESVSFHSAFFLCVYIGIRGFRSRR